MVKSERISRAGKTFKQRDRTKANREGSVFQRKRDGRWVVAVSLPDGKRKEWTFLSQAEGKEKLEIAREEMRRDVVPDTIRQTLGEYLDEWLAGHRVKKTLRPKTLETYEYLLRVHIKPAIGRLVLASLRAQDLGRFITQKCTEPSVKDPRKPLSASTVVQMHAIVSGALKQAVRERRLAYNPAESVVAPRIERDEIAPLDPTDAQRLIDGVGGDRLGSLHIFTLSTGVRQAEALGLTWDDVKLEDGVAFVRHQLQRVEAGEVDAAGKPVKKWLLRPIKSRAGRRVIALPDEARRALRDQSALQDEERTAAGTAWGKLRTRSGELLDAWETPPSSDLVFATRTGTPLDRSNVTHRYQRRLERLKLRRQPFHALRHANASLLIDQGIHPKDLQGHLGHAEYGTTMNIYGHRFAGAEQKVASLFDKALTPRTPTAPETTGA